MSVPKQVPPWLRLLIILMCACGALTALVFLPIKEELDPFLTWARAHTTSGAILLALAYILACVLLIPGALLTLGAGFALGIATGFVAVLVGSNLGATAAFLLGRTLARAWIERKVAANARFRALDLAIAEEGFKIVLLLRLSPVFPFNVLNYALGLTRVSVRAYVLATLLGMVPGILMYVYVGSLAERFTDLLAEGKERGPAEQVLFYLGLTATVVVTVWITWVARRALARAVTNAAEQPQSVLQKENHG
jgi:uncharacterized membrane protein YdjX (TVP38/TMEM64 family)